MKIAILSTNIEQVPPVGYGGTELIVHLLTESLVEKGHDVTLFAPATSITKARHVACVNKPLRLDDTIPMRRWQAYDIITMQTLAKMQNEFDIIHNHMGYQALPFLNYFKTKVVSTLHNPIRDYCAPIYFYYGNLPYVAISNSYKEKNYPEKLNYVDVIYNGIDINLFPLKTNLNPQYFLFIGRICQDKGTAIAINIARKLNIPLKIAGKVDVSDLEYFNTLVKPYLNSTIEYIGEVNHAEKIALYNNAIAVLYPIAFAEPFGLVMVESLATGTPVLAFNQGSVSEILEDGITGIVANTEAQIIEKFPLLEKINKDTLRRRVIDKFTKEKMIDNYLKLYFKLLN